MGAPSCDTPESTSATSSRYISHLGTILKKYTGPRDDIIKCRSLIAHLCGRLCAAQLSLSARLDDGRATICWARRLGTVNAVHVNATTSSRVIQDWRHWVF